MKLITCIVVFLLAQAYHFSNINYVVTTKQFQGSEIGHISFPATTYGRASYLTIAFHFATEKSDACLLNLGKGDDQLNIIVAKNKLVVQDSKTSATLNNYNLATDTYYSVILQFENMNGMSVLTVFLNGKDVSNALSSRNFAQFSNARRFNIYGGLCVDYKQDKHTTGAIYLDEFRIIDRKLAAKEIEMLAQPSITNPIDDAGVVVYYPFNEGAGRVTYGRPGTFTEESFQATLMDNARFTTRNDQSVLNCRSTGDPHITTFSSVHFTPKHQRSYGRLLKCKHGNDQGYFLVQAFHDFGHPSYPKAVLNRGFTIKYGKDMVKIDMDLNIYVRKEGKQYEKVGKVGRVGDIYFEYATNSKLFVYGAPFARLEIIKHGSTHMDIYMVASASLCKGTSFCTNDRHFIDEIDYETGTPDPIPPPLSDVPEAEFDPCQGNPDLQALADRVCSAKLKSGTPQYEACIFDVCATGDPTIPVVDEECIELLRKYLAEGNQEEADKLPCKDVTCECIHGKCVKNEETGKDECQCFSGYVGTDCSQASQLMNISLSYTGTFDGEKIALASHLISINSPNAMKGEIHPLELSSFVVEDSLLVYVASIRDPDATGDDLKHKYYLFVVGDQSGSSVSLNVNPIQSSNLADNWYVLSTDSKWSAGTGIEFTPFGANGLVYKELPANWQVKIDGSKFKQVVVGSGNNLGKLDVIKIPNDYRSSFTVEGSSIKNPCAEFDDCKSCMAEEECGWCRSNSRCLLGKAAGPIEGSSCPRWAFTFSDQISRRISAEFGVPVNPKKQDVFLVSGSLGTLGTLPAEITVDMGQSRSSVFDLAIISPSGGNFFSYFQEDIGAFLVRLQNYVNIGISFSTYNDAQLNRISVLESYEGAMVTLTRDLPKFRAEANPNGNVVNALTAIATNKQPNWRTNTRHVVFIVVENSPGDAGALKEVLLEKSILPVFGVSGSALVNEYKSFVKALGFGSVIQLDTEGNNLGYAIEDTIDIATKSVSLVPVVAGQIVVSGVDTSIWNIQGLQDTMRGRMQFPMHDKGSGEDVSKLVAPGYGTATIENLATDKPRANSADIELEQEQLLPENNALRGEIIELSGIAMDPRDPISIKIKAFGKDEDAYNKDLGSGKFYQLPDDIGSITSVDQLTEIHDGHVIENAAGKIIYVPPLDDDRQNPQDFSVSPAIGKNPWTTLTYVVVDDCTESDPLTLNIYITYKNKPPTNRFVPPEGYENKALIFSLDGSDERGHILIAVVDETPFQFDKNNQKQKVGTLYQYDKDVASTLTSVDDIYRDLNIDDVLSGLTVINDGDDVTDSQRRVIFIPQRYTNSEHKPSSDEYQIDPRITYHVRQILGPNDAEDAQPLESSSTTHPYVVHWVNQPPSVTVSSSPDEGDCTYMEDCVFKQNLGVFDPYVPNPVYLVLGGSDIEETEISITIDTVQCTTNTLLEDANNNNVVAGYTFNNVPDDTWSPLLKYRPYVYDVGTDICSVTYRVFDGELYSESATISISLTPVDQPAKGQDSKVYSYEGQAADPVSMTIEEVESDQVEGYIVSCVSHNESLEFTLTINNVQFTQDNCSSLQDNFDFGSIATTTYGTVGQLFFSIECPNCDGAVPIADFGLVFDDGKNSEREGIEGFPYVWQLVASNVVLNKPGLFWRGDDEQNKAQDYYKAVEEVVPTQGPLIVFAPAGINLTDPDSGPDTVRLVIQVQLFPPGPGQDQDFDIGLYVPKTEGENLTETEELEALGIIVSSFNKSYADLSAPIDVLHTALEKLSFNCGLHYKGYRNITYHYMDQGHNGACGIGNPANCIRNSYATLEFNCRDTKNMQTSIVAGATAGAAAVGIAVAVGAWLKFKKLRTPAEGPDPWLLDDQNEGVVDNPMYEQRGGEAENPLYDQAG